MYRLFTQLKQDVQLMKMAVTYLLTIRGIPQIFYGTEVLMDNTGHHKVDGLIRSDLPGGWKGDSANVFTGEGLTPVQQAFQSYLRKLLNWRKDNLVISNGKTLHFAPFNGVYVYFRYYKEKITMVVMNNNPSAVPVNPKRFTEILKNKTTGKNIMTGEVIAIDKEFTIPPKSAFVFEID
jgi:glycosidase